MIGLPDTLVTEIVGDDAYSYFSLGQFVVSAPGVCGGRPTFKYTRIEVAGVLELLTAGDTIDQLVLGYRGRLTAEAIEEAQKLVAVGALTLQTALEYA